jgi:serine protease AprX
MSRMTERRRPMPVAVTLALALPLIVAACETARPPAPNPVPALRESEDPFNKVNTALLKGGDIAEFSAADLPATSVVREPFARSKPVEAVPMRARGKISPRLEGWLKTRKPDEVALVIVRLRDTLTIPRLPEPAVGERRDSETNRKALARAETLIGELRAKREQTQAAFVRSLRERYRAEPVESFWLINAVAVKMPLGAVRRLATRAEVLYLEPDDTGTVPPQNAIADDDVDDGRARMVSDPYFGLGLTQGWIGLLDSGVRFSHILFNGPSHIDFRRDCVNGGSDCATGSALNPNDDCWDHGTSSAAILTANGREGDAFRGVTAITVDAFKVFPTSFDGQGQCNGNLSVTAAVRGFQTAVSVIDRVIVVEMQSGGSDTGSISTAADAAFDAGAVVIAANGNNGPNASTVNEPANAHKVIGVGNFDVRTLAQITSQSRGPAPGNRIKPDIQAPTNAETAQNGCGWQQNCATGGSDTAFWNFGGTSGATPFAGGVAALLRNWLRGTGSIDPGQVYAQLILSGQQPYPFNNTSGAGPLRLPTDGWAWWGKVSIRNGDTINIPLNIAAGAPNTFDGALWWPETATQQHNDVDLSLVDPSGTVRASSISIPSVFERARVAGAVAPGVWTLRIRGYQVGTASQTVYWAAHVRLR